MCTEPTEAQANWGEWNQELACVCPCHSTVYITPQLGWPSGYTLSSLITSVISSEVSSESERDVRRKQLPIFQCGE